MRYQIAVRAGYLGDVAYSTKLLRRLIDNVEGSVQVLSDGLGEWDCVALVEVPTDGAAKLVTDKLEDMDCAVSFYPAEAGMLVTRAEDLGNLRPDPNLEEWRIEAGFWEDWSRPARLEGEIQRRVLVGSDELGLDEIRIDTWNQAAWTWHNVWFWDDTQPAEVSHSPMAAPPEGWATEGLGKWVGRAVRLAWKATPVGRLIEVAAAGIYIGKEVYRVGRERYQPPKNAMSHYEHGRRVKMHSVEVRQRIVRERTPRGEYFRHYYARHERWVRTG